MSVPLSQAAVMTQPRLLSPPPFITDPIVPRDPLQHRLHHPLHRGDDTRGRYQPPLLCSLTPVLFFFFLISNV